MSAISKIQWTDRTWNPVRGCSVISPGCHNCYAMKQAHRFSGAGKPYEGLTKLTKAGPQWTGQTRLVEDALAEPTTWRDPARVFVNSMSDLFHETVPVGFIDRVFGVMAQTPRHTYQILTKRPGRLLQYTRAMADLSPQDRTRRIVRAMYADHPARGLALSGLEESADVAALAWPLPNVWLGVSAEDQPRADERIPLLLQASATVRFLSAEPLLAPIALRRFFPKPMFHCSWCGRELLRNRCGKCGTEDNLATNELIGLDWVIAGGESGPGARPCAEEWIDAVVQQCVSAAVPVFVKQLGSFVVSENRTAPAGCWLPKRLGAQADLPPKAPNGDHWAWRARYVDRKGGDPAEWSEALRVRQFPASQEARP